MGDVVGHALERTVTGLGTVILWFWDGRWKVARPVRRARRFAFEHVEPRLLLAAGPAISGHVFADANHDGVLQSTEAPLAGATIQLRNAQGVGLGTKVTDANGFYSFQTDPTISTAPTTITKTLNFPDSLTSANLTGQVAKFDPALGTLTAISITNSVTLSDHVLVESTDPQPSDLTTTIAGTAALSGTGFAALRTNTVDTVDFKASGFDGVVDFGGTGGHDFGTRSKSSSASTTITDPSKLAAYTGTGSIAFNELISAASAISGTANTTQQVRTSGSGMVSVTYTYIRNNALKPGPYSLVETSEPPGGYTNAFNSSEGAIQPGGSGTNTIVLNMSATGSTNNDFGESLAPTSMSRLAGFVFVDANDDGARQAGEAGLAGIAIQLTGIDAIGRAVSEARVTGADGSYDFAGLAAGRYTLSKAATPGFFDGKSTVGSQGGVSPSFEAIDSILLGAYIDGVNNNFSELTPSSLSGSVFFDANNNGVRDASEYGIAHADITLTGTDDLGRAVDEVLSTGDDGTYRFDLLRPGRYTLTESPAKFFVDGKSHIGTQGGSQATRLLSNISLAQGVAGTANDFGELARPGCKLPGLTLYHTLPGHRLAANQIGPKIRFAMPTLVPAITRVGRARNA